MEYVIVIKCPLFIWQVLFYHALVLLGSYFFLVCIQNPVPETEFVFLFSLLKTQFFHELQLNQSKCNPKYKRSMLCLLFSSL